MLVYISNIATATAHTTSSDRNRSRAGTAAGILLAGLVIWTLNVAGGHTASKMNEAHRHIMEHKPDIFILTDTKSDGSTIRTGWDWREYRIQESLGKPSGWHRCRNAGVLIGIKNTLTMVAGHTEVEGAENRLAHVTLKLSRGGKPVILRVVGIYAPAVEGFSTDAYQREKLEMIQKFFGVLERFLTESSNKKEHWILGGDYNVTLRPDERSESSWPARRHVEKATGYMKILSNDALGCFDWWGTRDDIDIKKDRTRRDWGQGREEVGNSIIDRFTSTDICRVYRIATRSDLFVPGTDHIITEAKFLIKDMHKTSIDEEHLRKWISRRVRPPRKEQKATLNEEFKMRAEELMNEQSALPTEIRSQNEFDSAYREMTNVITKASSQVYGNKMLPNTKIIR